MIASFRNRTRFTMLFLILVAVVGAAGLTNAEDVKHFRIMHKLDPAAQATVGKLDAKLTFELSNASFGDLLATVGGKAGVTILQSPEIASLDVQKARFSLKVENVPAHAVLMESLMPFELGVEPGDSGITIVNRPGGEHFHAGLPGEVERKIIIHSGTHEEADAVLENLESEEHDDGKVNKRVIVKKIEHAKTNTFDENGRVHREMNLSLDINGEKSTGKMTLDIQK